MWIFIIQTFYQSIVWYTTRVSATGEEVRDLSIHHWELGLRSPEHTHGKSSSEDCRILQLASRTWIITQHGWRPARGWGTTFQMTRVACGWEGGMMSGVSPGAAVLQWWHPSAGLKGKCLSLAEHLMSFALFFQVSFQFWKTKITGSELTEQNWLTRTNDIPLMWQEAQWTDTLTFNKRTFLVPF